MDTMWILWGWLIGIPVTTLAVARFGMWVDYDAFIEELGPSLGVVTGTGVLWPIALVTSILVLLAMPSEQRRIFIANFAPIDRDLAAMPKEDLIGEVLVLRKKLDKHAEKQIEELRKQYAKPST